jgi:7-keto-8-aminopelargonate synthetase-like enzyme
MTKSRLSFLDLADQVLTDATSQGVLHLYTEDQSLNGRQIHVKGRPLINFGSCSYLGLEKDPRLVQGCIDATLQYGTQLSSSRGYLSSGQYLLLESLFVKLFGAHCLVVPTTSLGHISALPTLVNPGDAIILDHQVHASVQTASQLVKARGDLVTMIRHNDLNQLEDKIKTLRSKHRAIWYCVDGVYSMYGDLAPIDELYALMDTYPQLHLYADDAHGFSWSGKHGRGTVRGTRPHHDRLVLIVSLNKAFGAAGGLLVMPNLEMKRRVRTCGGALVFSGPIQPPLLGAAIESAKIHLSGEIELLQNELAQRIQFTRNALEEANLPDVANVDSPIFYVGVGQLNVGINLVRRLMTEGYFTNIGMFPAVPINRTGIRFTTTVHQTEADLKGLVDAMAYHLPLALRDENSSMAEARQAFNLSSNQAGDHSAQQLSLHTSTTINDVAKFDWDKKLKALGNYGVDFLQVLETTFEAGEHPISDQHWRFRYLIIRDTNGEIVLATFGTHCQIKTDMFSMPDISQKAEIERAEKPESFVSSTIMMGSVASEGTHLFIDRKHTLWRTAVNEWLRWMVEWRDEVKAEQICLRDFKGIDEPLDSLLKGKSFLRVQLPDNHRIWHPKKFANDAFVNSLSYDHRRHWKTAVAPFIDCYDVVVHKPSATPIDAAQLDYWYELYLQVRNRALDINTYDLPKNMFENMMQLPGCEALELIHKVDNQCAAVVFQYWNGTRLCPFILGLNYTYLDQGAYRQALYQVRQRAIQLNSADFSLGFGAALEKRRIGAQGQASFAYIQANDTYSLEALDAMS